MPMMNVNIARRLSSVCQRLRASRTLEECQMPASSRIFYRQHGNSSNYDRNSGGSGHQHKSGRFSTVGEVLSELVWLSGPFRLQGTPPGSEATAVPFRSRSYPHFRPLRSLTVTSVRECRLRQETSISSPMPSKRPRLRSFLSRYWAGVFSRLHQSVQWGCFDRCSVWSVVPACTRVRLFNGCK
uniref:Putative serine protease n=1 Tax=Ixodes ricinus TaxID=34613 RepID=A0A0K8R379_IXORI